MEPQLPQDHIAHRPWSAGLHPCASQAPGRHLCLATPRRAGGQMLGVAGSTWAEYQLTAALPCPAALSRLDTLPALFCHPGVCERLHGLQCTHTSTHTLAHTVQTLTAQMEAHTHTESRAQQLWAEPQSDQGQHELSWGGQGDLSASMVGSDSARGEGGDTGLGSRRAAHGHGRWPSTMGERDPRSPSSPVFHEPP